MGEQQIRAELALLRTAKLIHGARQRLIHSIELVGIPRGEAEPVAEAMNSNAILQRSLEALQSEASGRALRGRHD